MSELSAYTEAVARRKAIDRSKSSMRVNNAIVLQLEDKDLPLLLEIIRQYDEFLVEAIDTLGDPGLDDEEKLENVGSLAGAVFLRVESLAETGCKKKWGEPWKK